MTALICSGLAFCENSTFASISSGKQTETPLLSSAAAPRAKKESLHL
jgi:hypothetical protein